MAVEEVRVGETVNVEEEMKKYNVQSTKDKVQSTKYEGRRTIDVGRDDEKKDTISLLRYLATSPLTFTSVPMFRQFLRVAAVLVILAIPSFFLYKYLEKPAMKELAANTGRIETILPDGSRITLNTGAVIRYPEHFQGKKRSVSLEGEAYFDVAHNASQPFIIATDGIRVEVKGTSFYINTRSMSGDFELVLTTGKVDLSFENQDGLHGETKPGEKSLPVHIEPGQKAIIHGHRITIRANEDVNYMAWKTRRIAFSNEPLNAVVALLSKVYQADVRLGDPALAQCRLTATFDNQSLESVLNVLKATLDVDIRNSGSLVEISGKGCR